MTQNMGVPPQAGSGCQPSASAAEEASSRSDIPNAARARVDCLLCTRSLGSFDDRTNHPVGGVEFTSPGHYGTCVFDPMNGDRLAINICDWCLAHHGKEGGVLLYRNGKRKPSLWRVPSHIMRNVRAAYLPAIAMETQRADTPKSESVAKP